MPRGESKARLAAGGEPVALADLLPTLKPCPGWQGAQAPGSQNCARLLRYGLIRVPVASIVTGMPTIFPALS